MELVWKLFTSGRQCSFCIWHGSGLFSSFECKSSSKLSKFWPEMAMLLGGALLKAFLPVFNWSFVLPLVLLTPFHWRIWGLFESLCYRYRFWRRNCTLSATACPPFCFEKGLVLKLLVSGRRLGFSFWTRPSMSPIADADGVRLKAFSLLDVNASFVFARKGALFESLWTDVNAPPVQLKLQKKYRQYGCSPRDILKSVFIYSFPPFISRHYYFWILVSK